MMILLHAFVPAIYEAINLDEQFETMELLDVAIGIFALLLFALSLSAYRKTRLRRLVLVSLAFLLFAADVVVRQLDVLVLALGFQADQVASAAIEFAILLLFFLAVVTKD